MSDKPDQVQEEVFDEQDYEAAFRSAAEIDGDSEVVEEPTDESDADEGTDTQSDEEQSSESETSPEVTRLEEQLAKMESILAEATKRAETKAPEAKKEVPQEDDDDVAALKEVEEDWPTIYRAMNVKIKALETRLAEVLGGFEKKITSTMAPTQSVVQEIAQDKFLTAINTAHPDATKLLPEVEKWITKQPAFLQKAYNSVLDEGTAQDVVSLYDTYKAATGKQPTTERTDKERRLQKMEGVKTERTSATTISDDDFEGAFERAARSN
jgi:hypothetical protein